MEKLRYLTQAEARRLKEVATSNRDRAIIGVLLGTGMRIGEAAGLQARDFDLEAETIHIERIVVHASHIFDRAGNQIGNAHVRKDNPEERVIETMPFAHRYRQNRPLAVLWPDGRTIQVLPKDLGPMLRNAGLNEFVKLGTKAKGTSGRTVPLVNQDTWAFVKAELHGREPKDWAWRAGGQGGSGNGGGRLGYTAIRDVVIRALGKADVPTEKRHPHVTRHTFAVHFLKNGGDLETLKRILGHARVAMTSIYLELVAEDLVQMAHKVDMGF